MIVRERFQSTSHLDVMFTESINTQCYNGLQLMFLFLCLRTLRKNVLVIVLHFLEFEVCNPLGSKRNKHKLCAIYYTIVRYSLVKQFGLDEIFKPLIDDLKKLSSEGITVLVDGVEENVCAAVTVISADNLSSHLIGGFSMSFNVGRICWYCMATHSNIKRCFNESDFVLRTTDVHRYHQILI